MESKIFLATHKKYTFPDSSLYVPIQAGADIDKPLGYTPDNTGDNISSLNRSFCELTVYYWVWKNVKNLDVVGVGHYRRIPFESRTEMFTKEKLDELFNEAKYDCLVNNGFSRFEAKDVYKDFCDSPESFDLPGQSTYTGYAHCHRRVDMDLAWEAIKKYYPEYEKTFVNYVVFDNLFIPCNILIARKEIFDSYCKWLFDILFFVRKYSPYETYDEYNKRVFGFLAERLFAVYLVHNNLKCGSLVTVDLEDKDL